MVGMNILSPSLLSIDFNHIERNAKVLDEAGVKWFHLDVMDGTFVRNPLDHRLLNASVRSQTAFLMYI